ncbi:MAG: septation protein SpoVG family protein [Candidatus Omnitrophica bacterium]|nr:septation protein SpoVG family protein [Candidatus Omnitrophota bacterium]
MEITDVRVFLRESSADSKLKAYATITFDHAFVVRNVKVIEGTKGLFVAMPSERAKEACPKCGHRNAVRSRFCNQCGSPLSPTAPKSSEQGGQVPPDGQTEHRDIAHPITVECREVIQRKVLEAYEAARTQGSTQAQQ